MSLLSFISSLGVLYSQMKPIACARSAFLVLILLLFSPAAIAGWGEDALQRESNYISDSSFTELAWNHGDVTSGAAAYGAINDIRVAYSGPDWVRPGESALAALSLMSAARQLQVAHVSTARYDGVLSRFFHVWLLQNRQGWQEDAHDGDFGGMAQRVFYDKRGRWQRDEAYNTGTTGMVLVALWKYSEYLAATGHSAEAAQWRRNAWAIARPAGNYLHRAYNSRYHLVQGNASARDLWISDSVYAADALRCLSRWAKTTGQKPAYAYETLAAQITGGVQAMRDTQTGRGFFKYRDSRHSFQPTDGDSLDQLAFLPYEADVLSPAEPFVRQISDWWTIGGQNIHMTAQTNNPADWHYFGLHWHWYFAPRPENAYLYPGPGLQLAAMEWKAGTARHDPVLLDRARKRYEWANKTAYSNLWLGDGNAAEAGVGNGLVDWRDAGAYAHKAEDWQRFVDTSAYFIRATLMICYGKDTKFGPE